jgi:3D (Asp-Asp-Asp) domain-containing protein
MDPFLGFLGPLILMIKVLVTAYCLTGTTATGTYVHPGTVATDPSVIRLGRHMYVPGYGRGHAEDTGGAIKGRHIDVWMSSCSAARTWGRRWRRIRVFH